MAYKIKRKVIQEDGAFDEKVLSYTYNYEKTTINAMLVMGREAQKRWKQKLKKELGKKEEITLFYDKKGKNVGVLVTTKKKPEKVLEVFELMEE